MKLQLLTLAAAAALCSAPAAAQFSIDTSAPQRLVTVGVRVGGNVSNTSSNETDLSSAIRMYTPSWKGGMTLGVVADINLREYISIQPGLFYTYASHGFDRLTVGYETAHPEDPTLIEYASATSSTSRLSYFQLPIMVSFKMNMGPKVKVLAEAGPYFQWGMGGTERFSREVFKGNPVVPGEDASAPKHERKYFGNGHVAGVYDWGFKMGVGVMFSHISLNVHYLAGCRNVLKHTAFDDYPQPAPGEPAAGLPGLKGYNKMWQFTLGYNF